MGYQQEPITRLKLGNELVEPRREHKHNDSIFTAWVVRLWEFRSPSPTFNIGVSPYEDATAVNLCFNNPVANVQNREEVADSGREEEETQCLEGGSDG
jgi:hypothetical protein